LSKLTDHIQITLTISDERWPELTAVVQRSGTLGTAAAVTARQQYDLAFGKFETLFTNQLRPAVDALIARRKGPKSQNGE